MQEQTAIEPTEETVTTQPEPTENTGTALAKPKASPLAVAGGVLPILPRNIPEATVYANGLIAANIVPDAFRYSLKEAQDLGNPNLKGEPNKSLILMGVLQALELGVAPQTGLKWLLPLRGRFTIWGDLAIALAQSRKLVKDQKTNWVGPSIDEGLPLGQWSDDFGCEYRIWRVGQEQPYIGTFTVRDAKRAKLWMNSSKAPWIDYPKRMLFNRARAFAIRDGFADALSGLEIAEEVRDLMPVEEVAKPVASLANLSADEQPVAEDAAS